MTLDPQRPVKPEGQISANALKKMARQSVVPQNQITTDGDYIGTPYGFIVNPAPPAEAAASLTVEDAFGNSVPDVETLDMLGGTVSSPVAGVAEWTPFTVVRVTATSPASGYFAAKVESYNPGTQTWTDLGDCGVVDPNFDNSSTPHTIQPGLYPVGEQVATVGGTLPIFAGQGWATYAAPGLVSAPGQGTSGIGDQQVFSGEKIFSAITSFGGSASGGINTTRAVVNGGGWGAFGDATNNSPQIILEAASSYNDAAAPSGVVILSRANNLTATLDAYAGLKISDLSSTTYCQFAGAASLPVSFAHTTFFGTGDEFWIDNGDSFAVIEGFSSGSGTSKYGQIEATADWYYSGISGGKSLLLLCSPGNGSFQTNEGYELSTVGVTGTGAVYQSASPLGATGAARSAAGGIDFGGAGFQVSWVVEIHQAGISGDCWLSTYNVTGIGVVGVFGITSTGTAQSAYAIDGDLGWTGTYLTGDGRTATVRGGLITNVA